MEVAKVIRINKTWRKKRRYTTLLVQVGDTNRKLGPFSSPLVCDVRKGDTFEWDGESIYSLKIIASAAIKQ